ncbi:MAG: HAMP domain-containing sensor histidine kinase [Ktedonobacterales bacterium]
MKSSHTLAAPSRFTRQIRAHLIPPTFPLSILRDLRQTRWLRRFTTFEKAILANSVIIVLVTLAGWWITQHNPETYHYIIDTIFIALAAILGLTVNFLLLRAAFAPLHSVLKTIRAVEAGDLDARVDARESDVDALALARTFNAMLDRLEQARDDAAARVLRAQETERRRLALELHDQTGQSLTALALHAEAIAQRLSGEHSIAATQAHIQAERLGVLAQQTLAEVQALSRQLRPSMLDDLGLPAALRWLAKDAGARLGVAVRVRIREHLQPAADPTSVDPSLSALQHASPETAGRLPPDVETALFRIAQESITNAVRHGHAHLIGIAIHRTMRQVLLTVADDGVGFQEARGLDARKRSTPGGLGIEGMRERARSLGGACVVRSWPARGTVIRVTLPLDQCEQN